MSDIQEKIEKELQQAREVCSTDGSNSENCAAAWDVVEELQAEASHQRQDRQETKKTSLESYCDENPEAAECRVYDD